MIKKANFNKNNSCNNFCCTKIENFSVTIGNNEILKDVNLHIHCGELTSIIGPNGAGKSTLLKALLGEVKHSGNLNFIGQNDNKYHQPIIGYVPQYLTFDKDTPISVLDLFVCCKTSMPSWLKPRKKIREDVLESLKRVKVPHLIDRRLGALSGGELQRVLLALALDPMPNILLLDEPMSALDYQSRLAISDDIYRIIKNEGKTTIMVTHDIAEAISMSDKIVVLTKRPAKVKNIYDIK